MDQPSSGPRGTSRPVFGPAGAVFFCLWSALAGAGDLSTVVVQTRASTTSAPRATVDEIMVTAKRMPLPAPFEESRSVSTRTVEDIARLQPDDVFEVIRDIPGISLNGGPRPSGTKINIRGFSDTEDVLVELDGIPRSFEKYRFGSGLFIEPELLNTIVVERTPSVARGSGALGGSVSATTKTASDLLTDGERLGVLAKTGFATNNDEWLLGLSAFGRPTARSGLLVAVNRRDGDDLRLPDGSRLDDSATDSESYLVKGDWASADGLAVALSMTGWQDFGPQPYDATGGQPGLFGTVIRDIDDRTLAFRTRYSPDNPWLDLTAVMGITDTVLTDLLRPGETPFSNANTGNVVDTYDYHSFVARLDNRMTPASMPWLDLHYGVQFLDSERRITRVTENAVLNDLLYPGGFNASQPSGGRRNLGVFGQARLRGGRLTLTPGLRWDRQTAVARDGTARLLAEAGEPDRISFDRLTPVVGLDVDVWRNRLLVFINYIEAFRPPLTDEYFTQGAFSRCNRALLGDMAPASGICGALYEPEEAQTVEGGVGLTIPLRGGVDLGAKVTVFRTEVSHVLESITVVEPGTIGQPGSETRRGVEVEGKAESERWFLRAGYARLRGRRLQSGDSALLYDLPADTLTLLAGCNFFSGRLAVGYRMEDVGSRTVVAGGSFPDFVPGTQEGYLLHGAFATLVLARSLELRIAADNLDNESYRLNDGFGGGPGTEAPGRNVRLALSGRW